MRLLLFLLAVWAAAESKTAKIEIRKTGSMRAKMIREGTYSQHLEDMYKARADSASQPIVDYQDDYYLVNVALGTPRQEFDVLVDTGSSNLWVIDAACTTNACNGDPRGNYTKNKFDSSKSSTFEADTLNFYLNYGSGAVRGRLAVDTFTFSGFNVDRQGFGLTDKFYTEFGKQPFDGVMGLGWPMLAADNVIPPMQNIVEQLSLPIFMVWFDRKLKPDQGGIAGQITYGAFDSDNCDMSVVNYVELSTLTYWQFEVDGMEIKNYNYKHRDQGISDTGTSWIGGPTTIIASIAGQTGARWNIKNSLYEVDCSKQSSLPDLTILIGGLPYVIPSVEYVLDIGLEGGKCAITFFDIQTPGFSPQFILGDTFIRTWCNIYDIGEQRIGFAKARH